MIGVDVMRTLGLLLIVVGLAACGDDLPNDTDITDESADSTAATLGLSTSTTTSTTVSTTGLAESSTTTTSGGTFGEVDECAVSSDCDPGLFCVAPFDESLGPEGKGLNACVSDCVGPMEETLWCADAAACCDPMAECTDRGYCEVPGSSTGDESGSGSDSGSGTGDSGTTTGG